MGGLTIKYPFFDENFCNALWKVWQHRRVLVEWLNDSGSELRFTELILAQVTEYSRLMLVLHVILFWSCIFRTRRTTTPGSTVSGCSPLSNFLKMSLPLLIGSWLTTSGLERNGLDRFRMDDSSQKQFCLEPALFCQLKNRGLEQGSCWKRGAFSFSKNYLVIIFFQVKFSLDKIQLVKRNESAWNYLRVCSWT